MKTNKLCQNKSCDCCQALNDLNKRLDDFFAKSLYDIWIPKKVVMKFFDYGETQMRVIEKQNKLQVSRIKARTFYSVESILNLLESSKIN